MPGVFRTRSLVCESRKHTSIITTGTPNIPAFPARWFYGLLRDLPGDRAFLPPSPRNAKHCRKLTPASRRQDHTTSPSAKRALVSRARRVHRTPRPTFVTIAKRPSKGARGGRISGFDLPDGASEIFRFAPIATTFVLAQHVTRCSAMSRHYAALFDHFARGFGGGSQLLPISSLACETTFR
jgi:hypothetical protein